MKTITEEQATKNTTLDKIVGEDSELKRWLVNHVGINSEEYKSYGGENNEVTVEMIVNLFSKEFPEFLLAVAEENWVRGYSQALHDVEEGNKLIKEALGPDGI
jgi:hypothetical protein